MKKLVFLLLLFLIPTVWALEPDGFVTDAADILSPEQESELETFLSALEQETTAEIAIVTIASLEGNVKEDYALELFEEWGIGKEQNDNGLLILVAVEERQWKIEVGYGLEGTITDGRSGRVARNYIVPYFQEENYYQGLRDTVTEFAGLIREDPSTVAEYTSRIPEQYTIWAFIVYILLAILIMGYAYPPKHKKQWKFKLTTIGILALVLFFIAFLLSTTAIIITIYILVMVFIRLTTSMSSSGKGPRRGGGFFYLGGGGSGRGGFGGFGGGGSGGGGSGGGW